MKSILRPDNILDAPDLWPAAPACRAAFPKIPFFDKIKKYYLFQLQNMKNGKK